MRRLLMAVLMVTSTQLVQADPMAGQVDAVWALGELNGVALQCKYIDQVRRMKAAVVANAPKERVFGLAFDEATNKAFLAFSRKGGPCPGYGGFESQVGERIEVVQKAFATP